MTKFTHDEIIEIIDKSDYPHTLTCKQMLKTVWWDMTNKKKFYYFIGKIKDGMQVKFAYEYADKLK